MVLRTNKTKNWHLNKISKSRSALSTVVTTLIVLVISVGLASVVAYYAINVTGTRSNEESLQLSNPHLWYSSATVSSQGVIMIVNTGGRDAVINKVGVRDTICPWANVYYCVTTDSISSSLEYTEHLVDGVSVKVGYKNYIFKQATEDLILQSGKCMMIYINSPEGIDINSVGLLSPVAVYTGQSVYYKEINVQALE